MPLLRALVLAALSASATADDGIVREFSDLGGKPYNVTYNERSMLVGGKPVLLMSGSVHYVRSTPEMWPEIFAKMKASGLNAVESCEHCVLPVFQSFLPLAACTRAPVASYLPGADRGPNADRCPSRRVLELPCADIGGPHCQHPGLHRARERHALLRTGRQGRSLRGASHRSNSHSSRCKLLTSPDSTDLAHWALYLRRMARRRHAGVAP